MNRAMVRTLTARIRWPSVHRPDQLKARSASASSSVGVESVSDAIQGLDCIKLGVGSAELAADPLDVAVDGAVVNIDVVMISDIEQLVARFDDSGALRERFEDQEFGDGQSHVPAVPHDLVAGRVHHQPA